MEMQKEKHVVNLYSVRFQTLNRVTNFKFRQAAKVIGSRCFFSWVTGKQLNWGLVNNLIEGWGTT